MTNKFSRTAVILGTLALVGGLGIFLKARCTWLPWGQPAYFEYTQYCYSDQYALYFHRDLNKGKIPYIEFRTFEYPVLTGAFVWVVAKITPSGRTFYFLSSILMLLFIGMGLRSLMAALGTHPRFYWFAAAPPLLLHGFTNWDLLAVGCILFAMAASYSQRPARAVCWLAVGFAAKLFPILFLPALLIESWVHGRRVSSILKAGGLFCGTIAVLFLPLSLWDYSVNGDVQGSWHLFAKHSSRPPGYETLWFALSRWFGGSPAEWARPWATLGMVGGAAGLWGLQWVRLRRGKAIDPWLISGAVMGVALMLTKVHSPQYSLWFLPFVVIHPLPAASLIGYFLADAFTLHAIYQWFTTSLADTSPWPDRLAVAVLLRTLCAGVITFQLITRRVPGISRPSL